MVLHDPFPLPPYPRVGLAESQRFQIGNIAILLSLEFLMAAGGKAAGSDKMFQGGIAQCPDASVRGAPAQMFSDCNHPSVLGLFERDHCAGSEVADICHDASVGCILARNIIARRIVELIPSIPPFSPSFSSPSAVQSHHGHFPV